MERNNDIEVAAKSGGEPEEQRRGPRKAGYPILELAVTLGALGIVVLGILFVENWRDLSSQPSSVAAPVFTDLNGNPIDVEVGLVAGGEASIGKPAADFRLPDPQGELVTLADYRGQPVLINFWATWCVPCRREVPDFVQLQADWGDTARIVGVNLQERAATVSQFAADFQMNYPLALDLDGEVTNAYRLTGLPETFFVDSAGILRDHRIGVVEPEIARCIVEGMLAGNHDPKDCR